MIKCWFKMKYQFIFLSLGILAFQAGFGQLKSSFGQSDPQAKFVLDAVSKKYKSFKNIQAIFKLSIIGPENKIEDTKMGTLILRGTSYNIHIEGQELICNGNTTWNYSKENNEVQVNNYQPESGMITPSRLFTDFYDKDFLYHLLRPLHENNRLLEQVEMTPLDKTKSFFKVILYIDNSTHLLVRSKIFDKSGNHYVYEILKLTPNIKIPNSTFNFDAKLHPNVSVIDLR